MLQIDGLLRELRDGLQGDAAVFLRFGQHQSRIIVSEVCVDGELVNWRLMRDGVGPAGFDHDSSDDAMSMRQGQWSLQAPAPRHFNTFCWLDEDIVRAAPWERSDAYRGLYEPNGLTQQYRAMLVDHGEVTGWVSVFWKQPPRHLDLLESRASGYLTELRRLAGEAHQRRRQSHRFLLDARGEKIAQDAQFFAAFDEAIRRALQRRCRPTLDEGEAIRFFGEHALRRLPMSGANGARATLVLLEPLEPVAIDMREALTARQRRVAELVAEGHSNSQVAEILELSANTVKYHLKNIYPIVGVTNRVELASFLSGGD